jgi:hypothetical protein
VTGKEERNRKVGEREVWQEGEKVVTEGEEDTGGEIEAMEEGKKADGVEEEALEHMRGMRVTGKGTWRMKDGKDGMEEGLHQELIPDR